MSKLSRVLKGVLKIYTQRQIPRAAAALSYYLTMTVFPMIICLYALFGQSYAAALRVLNYFKQFLTPNTVELLREYLKHVARSDRSAILLAAMMVLLMPASAAIRLMESTIGEMQGGRRFRARTDILLSFVFAVGLVLLLYFAILVMLTGQDLLNRLSAHFPVVRVAVWWTWLRYLLLGVIAPLIIWGIFAISRRRNERYRAWPGALLATAAIIIMSYIFSGFIAVSSNYSLVYGSLASLILLMFWLFLSCQMIFVGAAFNVSLRDCGREA